jgi:hypothetical protein
MEVWLLDKSLKPALALPLMVVTMGFWFIEGCLRLGVDKVSFRPL